MFGGEIKDSSFALPNARNTNMLVSFALGDTNFSRFTRRVLSDAFYPTPVVTCFTVLALLDTDDDLRAGHELWNTERLLKISQIGAEI